MKPPPIPRVDYDAVAPAFDQRYVRNRYEEMQAALEAFVGDRVNALLEIGCGTGHWLATLGDRAAHVVGVEPSAGMLAHARRNAPGASLARAFGESLPLRDACCERVVCVNVLHHSENKPAFLAEARRVLRPGGGIFTAGLDPHTGTDEWWVYDYFPTARTRDLVRYPSTQTIRETLSALGFVDIKTEVCQHFPVAMPYEVALERGVLDRQSTSQLMVIDTAEYEAGRRRMDEERPVVSADLRIYATSAKVAADGS